MTMPHPWDRNEPMPATLRRRSSRFARCGGLAIHRLTTWLAPLLPHPWRAAMFSAIRRSRGKPAATKRRQKRAPPGPSWVSFLVRTRRRL